MKKALVFVTAFALVLVAGAAVALIGTPGGYFSDDEPLEIEETATTVSDEEKVTEEPVAEEPKVSADEPKEEESADHEKEESSDEPKEEPKEEEKVEETEEAKDTDPPDLVILSPEDGQHFDEEKVVFEGKTEPGAKVFAHKYEADVDKEGNWRIVLILTNDGGNRATFTAVDAAGNETTASVTVYYDAPAEEEPKEEESYEFTANQKFGSCSEDPAYDVWYGTGEPGTEIWIGSEYGSASTTVGEKGKWDLKAKFPEAPCNQTIEIVLETDQGHRMVFEFTRICDEDGGEHEK